METQHPPCYAARDPEPGAAVTANAPPSLIRDQRQRDDKENSNRQIDVVTRQRTELNSTRKSIIPPAWKKIAALTAIEARNQLIERLRRHAQPRAVPLGLAGLRMKQTEG